MDPPRAFILFSHDADVEGLAAFRDASSKPITMERLMALSQALSCLMKTPLEAESLLSKSVYEGQQLQLVPTDLDAEIPMAASQLQILFIDVHFDPSTDLSHIAVLVKGNARHCSERCTEAILSVLDVRE